MNVVDVFSGVGGLSTGFKKAGYDIILANEIDPMISDSYSYNHEETLMINEDIKYFAENFSRCIDENIEKIKDVDRRKMIKNKISNVDVLIGGPPCQGFSMAGARIRKTNEFIEDPRNYLFKYYFKVLRLFEPEFFVFENVPGLVNIKNGDILNEIISIFSDSKNFKYGGYKIETHIVDASKVGVPQKRKRLIIIGSKTHNINLKEEIEKYIKLYKISSELNVYDAISDLSYLNSGEGSHNSDYIVDAKTKYQLKRRKNSKMLFNHIAPVHAEKTLNRIKEVLPGENYLSLKDHGIIKSVHSGSYGRLNWDKPAPTITTRFDTPSAGRVIHPTLDRALTPREAARLQSFDDDYIFYGNKSSIGKQIGNAVPPLLAEVLANIILKYSK